MSVTFTKLFSSITASTVWCESSDTRVVWITMLAMADRHGRVWASIPGLAKEAAVSVSACRTAINKFLSPDPESRTKTAEGRRIEPIDGGWRLINHAKYRAIRDEEERRAYKAEKQREYRAVDNVDKSGPCGPPLTTVDRGAHNAEAEADTEKKGARKRPAPKPSVGADGELMAATHLAEEIGLSVTHNDVAILAGVIRFAARDAHCDTQQATEQLIRWGKEAAARGDAVTVFWFKDRKFMQDGGKRNGKAPPNPGASQTAPKSDDEAFLIWESMSDEYKKANPFGK